MKDAQGKVWSREVCGGPHVDNTGGLAIYPAQNNGF
ncbi:MAG: hypothetical protein HFG70_05900 [Hungatella sp.]|nr:hypothetical protein [Hungatella sp.]